MTLLGLIANPVLTKGLMASPAAHPPLPPPPTRYIRDTRDITAEKKLLKIQQCQLVSRNSYKTM